MHIVDRRLNPGSKSLENRQRFLRRAKARVQGAVKKSSQDRDIRDVTAPIRLARYQRHLAAKVIDSFPVTTDAEEAASRKRRLLKGPEEFRDLRVDRPKAKTK